MLPAGLICPSGGLGWHYRAFRYRRIWSPLLRNLDAWLATWRHNNRRLLILGASAGWCLPSRFLSRYEHITAVDMDPVAPTLFGLVHGLAIKRSSTRIVWQRIDVFSELKSIVDAYEDHAVLFSNILGQHLCHSRDVAKSEDWIAAVHTLLPSRPWASFHDRISGEWAGETKLCRSPLRHRGVLDSEALAIAAGVRGEWNDHLTAAVFPAGACRRYFGWRITPKFAHVIEAGALHSR